MEAESARIDLSLGQKLYEFYRAPITKFWANVVCIFKGLISQNHEIRTK